MKYLFLSDPKIQTNILELLTDFKLGKVGRSDIPQEIFSLLSGMKKIQPVTTVNSDGSKFSGLHQSIEKLRVYLENEFADKLLNATTDENGNGGISEPAKLKAISTFAEVLSLFKNQLDTESLKEAEELAKIKGQYKEALRIISEDIAPTLDKVRSERLSAFFDELFLDKS